MGGMGSGRGSGKIKCEACSWIDVRAWVREGVLEPGTRFQCRWSSGNKIAVAVTDSRRLELRYAIGGVPVLRSVGLTQTPCNYGGSRTWFVAPCCGTRVAKLYFRRSTFSCRKCHRLAYHVQSLDPIQRQHYAMARVEALLDDGERPKGMHWSTFDKLQDRMQGIDDRLNLAFTLWAEPLLGRIGEGAWARHMTDGV